MRGVGSCATLNLELTVGAPYRHLGKLGCVRSDPYEPTSTGIGVGRGGAATQNAAHLYSTGVILEMEIMLDWSLVREMGDKLFLESMNCSLPLVRLQK